jgi:transaldolase / glucose-6-phosphate isomerase
MIMSTLHSLAALGQSIWYDNISRDILQRGELTRMVTQGLCGVTSNPTIFQKAIAGSQAYDEQIQGCLDRDPAMPTQNIITALMISDIQDAADTLLPVYRETKGRDGFVSVEVTPSKARDTEATLSEASDLWHRIDRPNLMVKIPGTKEGIPAIREMIREGVNINVTLLFSLERYIAVAEAYLEGLERRLGDGCNVDRVASVASVFVSRVDTMVDQLLADAVAAGKLEANTAASLMGTAAVANAQLIYEAFRSLFGSKRFAGLQARGATVQRPLWASTGTKNPAYSDLKYVDPLIGPDTVNTVPPATLAAILDHCVPAVRLHATAPEAKSQLGALAKCGIDIAAVTAKLEEEGVTAFTKSFDGIIETLEQKRATLTVR